MFGKVKKIHFVGIGGIGMSGLALVLKNLGFEITGSDIKESAITRMLEKNGIPVYYSHRTENVKGADTVVYSSAIRDDNPEIVAARSRRLPVIQRAEMLGELMRLKFSIAVSGTHGKTTTTSIIGNILEKAGLDPTLIIGGRVMDMGVNAKLGGSKYLVAEADESDGSFLLLYPTVAVITNIDREHLNYFGTLKKLKEAFIKFANRVPFYGSVVLCADDNNVGDIIPAIKRKKITYGFKVQSHLMAADIRYSMDGTRYKLIYEGKKIEEIFVPLYGIHNVYNSLAAIGVGMDMGIPLETIKKGLESFKGVHRRLEFKGEKEGVYVFDDYGHHPTEIRHTLSGLRQIVGDRRIIVIFQPHRYTRTKLLYREFGQSFNDAELIILLPIYPAAESPIPGVSSKLIYDSLIRNKKRVILTDTDEVLNILEDEVKENDVIITLGAGDVWKIGLKFLETS